MPPRKRQSKEKGRARGRRRTPTVGAGLEVHARGDTVAAAVSQITPVAMGLEALAEAPTREFILIAGKDGVGKTSATVAMCKFVEDELNPSALCFVFDTENGWPDVWRAFGEQDPSDRPGNVIYYPCAGNMELTLASFQQMRDGTADPEKKLGKVSHYNGVDDSGTPCTYHRPLRPGDWVIVETMGAVWELAQDLGYREVTGASKSEFLLARRKRGGAGSPLPAHPDQFWNIVKAAHDSGFMNPMIEWTDVNVVWATPLGKSQDRPGRRENADRRAVREEFGIDANLAGIPLLAYKPDTTIILSRTGGRVSGTVLKDRKRMGSGRQVVFGVPNAYDFGYVFHEKLRGMKFGDEEEDEEAQGTTESSGEEGAE